MKNPEKLATYSTQDTGQINVREHRRGNQQWTIQRNWQHIVHKTPVSLDCSLLIAPSVFSNVYLSCVLCTICGQFLWIVHCWLPLQCSLTFICPVSCVLYVASFFGLFILISPSMFSNVYFACVLCTICCKINVREQRSGNQNEQFREIGHI
jgi:hypothetical protein